MEIRSGRPDDGPALLRFWSQAAHGTSITDDLAGVERLLAKDPDAVLVAETSDHEIVGTLIAGWDGWRCHLYRLAVDPRHRRAGIGRALLTAAEERFATLGGRRVDAMVDDDNPQAHGLYRAAGYDPQPSWTRWVRPLQ